MRTVGFPPATQLNCLTSPMIRTPWPVILNGRYNAAPQSSLLLRLNAISAYSCLVSGSFNLPSGVLFSFHSRYYFTIGLGSYLELEVYASHIHARYPTHTTQDPFLSHELTITGLSPFIALHSRRFHVRSLGKQKVYNTTSPTIHHSGIQFALYRFRSPLLTASLLISFPAGTKMLQSPAFLAITGCTKVQEVPFGNLRIKGSLRLPGAFRNLARPSSAPEPSHSPNNVASHRLSA